ncbi:MAG TPA: hypothetical protein VN132_13220, partial [Bdellovibrio sp.]|nr:hypothetical protein [Bdellovibrio sp.]
MCLSIFGSAYTYRASQEVLDRFSYGYEVEFVPSQNPKILLYYKVAKYSDAIWLKMTLRQRLAAFNEYIGRYPKTVRTLMAGLGQIVMTRLENAPAFLPQKASVEAHGTIEISGEVFDKEVEMSARVRRTDETLGKGYWQAHVVFPKEYVNDISGFVSFSTDFAYLQSLSKSYERYLKNPQVIPGSVLVHYALGPISQKDFNSLINKNE